MKPFGLAFVMPRRVGHATHGRDAHHASRRADSRRRRQPVSRWCVRGDGSLVRVGTRARRRPERCRRRVALPGPAQRVARRRTHAPDVLLEDGTVVAWGANDEGQLGNGASGSNKPLGVYPKASSTPRQGPPICAGITAIAAGFDQHAIAATPDGRFWAWGARRERRDRRRRRQAAWKPARAQRDRARPVARIDGHHADPPPVRSQRTSIADARRQDVWVGQQRRGRADLGTRDTVGPGGSPVSGEHRRNRGAAAASAAMAYLPPCGSDGTLLPSGAAAAPR